MFEDYGEQEVYEEPDYNVWETNRVYEDMAIERAEAEADAADEMFRAHVEDVVIDVMLNMPWLPLDVVQSIAERILRFEAIRAEREKACPHCAGVCGRDPFTCVFSDVDQ